MTPKGSRKTRSFEGYLASVRSLFHGKLIVHSFLPWHKVPRQCITCCFTSTCNLNFPAGTRPLVDFAHAITPPVRARGEPEPAGRRCCLRPVAASALV